jgi:hypothetical protein
VPSRWIRAEARDLGRDESSAEFRQNALSVRMTTSVESTLPVQGIAPLEDSCTSRDHGMRVRVT